MRSVCGVCCDNQDLSGLPHFCSKAEMNQGKVNSVSSSATLNAGGDKWLKRTANSEEELSEGSSSSGSNPKGQMDAKHNKDNSKRGRPARRSASKRKWSDDSKSNEELDADWNADDVGLDNSSDSDPVWSPGSKQVTSKVIFTCISFTIYSFSSREMGK